MTELNYSDTCTIHKASKNVSNFKLPLIKYLCQNS